MMTKIKRLASKEYRDAYLPSRVRSTVAIQVRTLRRAMGMSQVKFAKLIGVTQSMVSDLENPDGDQVSVQTLLNIAAALDVALVVKFVSYTDFLKLMSDMSPKGLAAEAIDKTIARSKQDIAASTPPVVVDFYTGTDVNIQIPMIDATVGIGPIPLTEHLPADMGERHG